jgi:hypothetical protein
MATSLEDRFTRFLGSLPGAESIDALTLPTDPNHPRKADFLLANREIIVELKTLTVDTSHKIEPAIDKHRDRDEFPLFYGEADLKKVLSHLPDGEEIHRRIYLSITRSVEEAVRSAEEQIDHTRHVLALPNAISMLVILNESVQVLDPTVVGYRVANLMNRKRTGASRSPTLDFVWLLFESHSLGGNATHPYFPSMLIRGERASNFPWFSAFHDDITHRWAKANNAAILDAGSPTPNSLQYTAIDELRKPIPQQLPRHEVWRREYRMNPYLRQMSDGAVLEHGATILRQLLPHFTKGGPGYVENDVIPLMVKFTHFQEEASFRALDWRDIPKL